METQCVNPASLDALVTDWGADVLRVSMYVQEGGYETDPQLYTDRVNGFVEQASARGLYVIVDWHMLEPGDPNANLARAKTFFAAVAQRHAARTNVLYEIANEPSGVSWASIRSKRSRSSGHPGRRPDAVGLVGTRVVVVRVSEGAPRRGARAPVNAQRHHYTSFYAPRTVGVPDTLARGGRPAAVFVTESAPSSTPATGATTTRAQAYSTSWPSGISWTNWNSATTSAAARGSHRHLRAGGPYAGTSR